MKRDFRDPAEKGIDEKISEHLVERKRIDKNILHAVLLRPSPALQDIFPDGLQDTAGKFVNRGFLNGPVCPIYGTGVAAILLILGNWAEKPWAVLLVGIASTRAGERPHELRNGGFQRHTARFENASARADLSAHLVGVERAPFPFHLRRKHDGASGVHVVFDGSVILGTRAKKTRTRSYNAFSSIDYPDIAIVRDGKPTCVVNTTVLPAARNSFNPAKSAPSP